ncbi:recombinase family protein [Nonomuraea wenchangensis]
MTSSAVPGSPPWPTTSPRTAWSWKCSPESTARPGRMLFAFFAAMAETEREAIREATLEGLDAAARRGNHGGRPTVASLTRGSAVSTNNHGEVLSPRRGTPCHCSQDR